MVTNCTKIQVNITVTYTYIYIYIFQLDVSYIYIKIDSTQYRENHKLNVIYIIIQKLYS